MLKKKLSFLIVMSMLITTLLGSGMSVQASSMTGGKIQAQFFVAPTGNDTNDGSYDHPFATMQAARDAVRLINEEMTGDIYVFIAPGNYYVNEPITFDKSDSGTNGFDVIYRTLGAPGSVSFIGGMNTTSAWSEVQASADPDNPDSDMQQSMVGKVYKTNLQSQLNTIYPNGLPATSGPLPNNANGAFHVNTLYVNDTRVTQARTLNSNKYPGFPSSFFDNPLYSAGGSYISMTYKAADASNIFESKLINAQARGDLTVQIVANDIGGDHSWNSDTLPVTNINPSSKVLTFNPNNVADFASLYWIGGTSRYYLQGNLAYLDTPGEFYFNPVSYDLYYYPQDDEVDLEQQNIVVPTTEQIINITGERTGTWDDTVITPVHNIVFDGLGFKDTSSPSYYSSGFPWLEYGNGVKHYPFPDYAKNSSNPTYAGQSERPQFMSGVLTLNYASHLTITNSHIKNAGLMGVELGVGTSNVTVSNSLIEYTGHGGVDIQGGFPGVDGNSQAESFTNHNLIDNLVIHDVGQLTLLSYAVGISNATYNTVSHIEMYNSPRRAIILQSSNVQGWDNGWLGDGYTNPDFPYDLKRDQYAHHNTLSNIYIHNVQQDGGDDGAIMTAFLYYPRDNYSQPNYFNQIIVDKVAAIPTMNDIAPNNINFDMGWVGIHTSNIKTVNAHQYNIENDNLQNGQVVVDNTTFNFRGPQDGLENFDDSKMDYANIGVQTWRYPAEFAGAITNTAITPPQDLYFSDNFEEKLDLTKWSYSGVQPTITKEYMSEDIVGKGALDLNNLGATKSMLYRNFADNLNKVVTVDFFDRAPSRLVTYGVGHPLYVTTNIYARVDDGTTEGIVAMGVNSGINGSNYVVNVGNTITATSLRRTTGWHTLKFDYSTPGTIVLSIDGEVVKTLNSETWENTPDSFNYVSLGSPNGTGHNYFDQFNIYGGNQAPDPGFIPFQAPPDYDSSNDNIEQLDWDFEDSVTPSDFTNYYSGTLSVVDNPESSGSNISSKVLYQSGGVSQYTNQTWSNYMLKFKWKLGEWNNASDNVHQYDGFTIFVDAQGNPTANPSAYQVIFRRNMKGGIPGGGQYPAGTPFFSINQHNPGDTTLATAPAPEGFDPSEWHDFQIQVFGGKIGLVVDGQKIISHESNAYTSGSFGFGTYNSDQYFDDIQIISNPRYVNYASNLNLGNAALNGDFNPGYDTYMATVIDDIQPVTLIKPKVVLDNTSIAIKLNDTDITSRFADDVTPVSLDLNKGRNVLVLNQTTLAGSQNYTVYVDKPYTIESVDEIAPITAQVGIAPTLPAATNVTFTDGTSQIANIQWDLVDPSQYKQTGTFTLSGQLVGLNGTISITVSVEGLESLGQLEDVTTVAGTEPELPSTISAQFTNENRDLALTFAEFDLAMYANAGTIIAVAKIDQYEGDVLQKVIVEAAPITLDDLTAPTWPVNTAAAATKITKNSLTLSWTPALDAVGVTEYKITWEDGNKSVTVDATVNSVDITGLNAGTKYVFTIEASDAAGNWSTTGPIVSVNTQSGNSGGVGTGTPGDGGNTPDPGDTSGNGGNPIVFTDISGHWAKVSIQEAIKLGFIAGYTDGTFRPNAQTSRSEFAAMLSRTLKLEGEGEELAFADLEQIPAWARPFIARTTAAGILQGYSDHTFRPDRNITRAEMAVMIVRALGLKVDSNAKTTFADANTIPAWAKPYVAAANEAGLIKGRGNNLFAPNENATRAEAVIMILALLNYE
ncbi:hypothetical protein FHS15_003878 [Paenibacillus castaneae]|uniref:S-layer homology domain-containing protein n=1 Tax=Paenibacillus castaneae TaxID=474957 RepID=UPI000C9AECAA|nr:S-layer homology domain-containing protein [Paenibacillus castaneae]NIK78732.1 hypothetical protein [Paenibacillus castaneae]